MTGPVSLSDLIAESLRAVIEDPAGTIDKIRRRVHTEYFLRRFHVHQPEALAQLFGEWQPLAGRPGALDPAWIGHWLERQGLPDTDDARQLVRGTLRGWKDWLQHGEEPPLEWWPGGVRWASFSTSDADREPLAPTMELRPEQQGWPPGPFNVVVPGWGLDEGEAEFKARAQEEFRRSLKGYVDWAKLFRKAFANEELLLAEPSSKTRGQLDLLAEYQAKPDLSQKMIAERSPDLKKRQVQYALHKAAGLIELPIERLNQAPGVPPRKKRS